MRKNQIKTLILTLQYAHRASYYDDWANGFSSSEYFECTIMNLMKITPLDLQNTIESYDLIILLHSATGDSPEYLDKCQPQLMNRKRAKLLAFVGNEFNSPYVPLSDKIDLLKDCRADVIATQLLEEAGQYLYGKTGAKVFSIPHALNPDLFNATTSFKGRNIDIGMRSYRYPPYLGDNDRNRIIDYFDTHSSALGLVSDINTTQRFTPANWAKFLGQCKSVLTTETGSWYLNRSDDLVKSVLTYAQQSRSGLVISETNPLRRLVRHLPAFVKSPLISLLKKGPIKYGMFEDEKMDFDDVYARFFQSPPKCPAYSKAISSRNFDAIGTRTCQVSFPGRFNDILSADAHYISLNPDFSNINEVIEKLRDESIWKPITENAYALVLDAHTYAHRARQVSDIFHTL